MMPISNPANTSGTVAFTAVGARVYHSVNQSLASDAVNVLAFNSERFDTDTIHDIATNNSRLTCKTAGTYLIGGGADFSANSTGIRQIFVRLNGSTILAVQRVPASSVPSIVSVSTIYELAVNDYVELIATQNSGASLTLSYSSQFSPEFYMYRLS